MALKMPWVDTTKCTRKLDCKAASYCEYDAFLVRPESEETPGKASGFPVVDFELCKRCGDCEKACAEKAVKMI